MFNVRIWYAHGIVHDFIRISEKDAQLFSHLLKSKEPYVMEYEYNGTTYYENREFVCCATIEPVQAL